MKCRWCDHEAVIVLAPRSHLGRVSRMIKLAEHLTIEDWRKENGKFIPYPGTWLNAKGWESELGPVLLPPVTPAVKVFDKSNFFPIS